MHVYTIAYEGIQTMSISIPLSVRVPQEDFEWLTGLDVPGTSTPSDKLRAIIQRYRRQLDGSDSYELTLGWLRELVQPFARGVAGFEHRREQRSEIVATMLEWVPQLMALLASEQIDADASPERARKIEDQLLQRSTALISALLRLGVAPDVPAYDSVAIDRQLPKLAALVDAVRVARQAA
jgi:hypothetical protein